MAALKGNLQDVPLNADTRQYIVANLWEGTSVEKSANLDLRPYFDYYEDECDHALHERGAHVIVRTHEDIINIAKALKAGHHRHEIKNDLKKLFKSKGRPDEDEILNNSVDLAVRLYLMVNVGGDESTVMRGQKVPWDGGVVKDALAAHFNEPPILSNSNIRFENTFTAHNLERMAGIKITWTNNLADHLRMVDNDDKIVAVFHHATFLNKQASKLYPPGLIEETLRTLMLLFPQKDAATRKWLASLPVDRQLSKCGQLRLNDRQVETYRFWHDRLIILKQAFDESRPDKLSQWWYDRRNGYQWYTFWVAVFVLFLTIFFGMVQSIEGALQVYKAYHPTSG